MNNNSPLLNAGSTLKFGCYAHLPGTGPFGQTCSACNLQVPDKSKFVCSKYQKLTGRKGKPISTGSPACKYFEPRPAFNTVKG
jgi:hypothetical protein